MPTDEEERHMSRYIVNDLGEVVLEENNEESFDRQAHPPQRRLSLH